MRYLKRWTVAIALFLALILDGSISHFVPLLQDWGVNCWLTLIGLTLVGLEDEHNHQLIWLGLVLGLIADAYYLGIFGIYTFIFPMAVFGAQQLSRFLPVSFWFRWGTCIIIYAVATLYHFLAFYLVGLTQVSFRIWQSSLMPNLIWAALLSAISYPLWLYLATKFPFLVREETY